MELSKVVVVLIDVGVGSRKGKAASISNFDRPHVPRKLIRKEVKIDSEELIACDIQRLLHPPRERSGKLILFAIHVRIDFFVFLQI